MKFHGIENIGKFYNQTLASLPTWQSSDEGRQVYLEDGTIWYATDIEWKQVGEGTGGTGSAESDIYSDLLDGSIYKNLTWDDFSTEDRVNGTNSTMTWDEENTKYTFSTGELLHLETLYDNGLSLTSVSSCMVSVDYTDSGSLTIQVTNDGSNWVSVENNQVYDFSTSGTTLEVRFYGGSTGEIRSFGVLYNKDPLALNYQGPVLKGSEFIATQDQDTFQINYEPTTILVYLNGRLLGSDDYTATNGTSVVLDTAADENDVVYICTPGTIIMVQDYAVTNKAQSFSKAQRSQYWTLADGATVTPDMDSSNNFRLTLGGNRTLANPINQVEGQSGVFVIRQDATGSRTLTFGSNFKFPGGIAPTLSTSADAMDVVMYEVESVGNIICTVNVDFS